MKLLFCLSIIVLLFLPIDALAHHGKEFLVSSTYKTPEKGRFFALISTDYLKSAHNGSGFQLSPSILYGITNRWSAEFHTHHSLSQGDFHTESLALETHFRFFGPGEAHDEVEEQNHSADPSPFSLAALFEYEKGLAGEADALEGRLIAGKDLHQLSIVLNLAVLRHFEEGEGFQFRYAFGIKTILTSIIGAGIEFDNGTSHENTAHLTPGIYASVSNKIDIRIGASFGLANAASSTTSLRSVIIYSF